MATASTSPKSVLSENILSSKTDLCISNGIVKVGLGFGVGVIASAVLFRRRAWPVFLGTGFGLGQGYSDCERIFNPASIPGYVLADAEIKSSNPTPYAAFNPFSSATTEKVEEVIKVAQNKLSEVVGNVKESENKLEKKVEKKVEDLVTKKKEEKKMV